MVAITVILAAVIAAFVFGMGGNLSESPPTVSITASSNSASSGYDLKVNHNGGDLLKGSEWKISVVAQGDVPRYVFSEGLDDFQVGGQILVVGTVSTADAGGPCNFTAQDVPWSYSGDAFTTSGAKYDVKIVHVPSNSLVLDTVVEIR